MSDDVPDAFKEAEERRLQIASIAQGAGPYRSAADRRAALVLAELMLLNPQAPQRILSERDSVKDVLRGYVHEDGGYLDLEAEKERLAEEARLAAETKNRKKRKGRFS